MRGSRTVSSGAGEASCQNLLKGIHDVMNAYNSSVVTPPPPLPQPPDFASRTIVSQAEVDRGTYLFIGTNISEDAIDLITSLCSWDPCKRPTAMEALRHPFFQLVRGESWSKNWVGETLGI